MDIRCWTRAGHRSLIRRIGVRGPSLATRMLRQRTKKDPTNGRGL